MRRLVRKWALKNAVDHGGKARDGPVISKAIGEDPGLKNRLKELKAVVSEVVTEVNLLPLEEQRRMLTQLAPELLERRVEVKALPPLPKAEMGKVVTRLPPEPSGFMHMGHGMGGLLNYLYAEMYDGKLWLRFEDTNPRKVSEEFYLNFKKGYRWLGIEWDYEKKNSDDMELYYDKARELISGGFAYTCSCPVEEVRRRRRDCVTCRHRDSTPDVVLDEWERMVSGESREGEVTLRLKGDMRSNNTVMRDPTLFRVVHHLHPYTGDKYSAWPTYDFAAAVEDAICGITHVLRTSEFALRDELQEFIRGLLHLKNPVMIEYSRFNFEGTPLSKRRLRPLVEGGLVSGWDDPRMPTIDGVARRGIIPEAIREFTLTQTGITQATRAYHWDLLFAVNRKILDPVARRYYFVPDPVPCAVADAPQVTATLRNHPDKDLGTRTIPTHGRFFLPRQDVSKFKPDGLVRLKGLYNIRVEGTTGRTVNASLHSEQLLPDVPIIQWVTDRKIDTSIEVIGVLYVDGEFNKKSLRKVTGFAEEACSKIEVGTAVQLERFGFCRLDRREDGALVFIFTHR